MIDTLIDRYVQLRDRKDELKKAFDAEVEKIVSYMDQLEKELAKALDAGGVDRMGGKHGVAFFANATSATVENRDAYLDWLKTTGQWSLADIRAAKKQIAEYKNEFHDIPPGIKWREARVVQVRRA